jgi:hypothetical protein
VTVVAAGSCKIAADQAASTNYNAAPQVSQTFNVAKAPTLIQLTVAPLPPFYTTLAAPSTLSGKVNRPGLTSVYPPGPVSITVQKGASPPVATLNAPTTSGPDGVFTATDGPPPTIPSDSYTVTFSYGGDSNFLSATPVMSTLRVEGFSAAGNMLTARTHHATVLLPDGRVLATGGNDGTGNPTNTAEIYCPDTLSSPPVGACPAGLGAFSPMNMNQTRVNHTATVLPNGKVIVVGGVAGSSNLDEIWDPATQTWTNVTISSEREHHTATLLNNGKVFIAGGNDSIGTVLTSTVIYDPATGTSTVGPGLLTPRQRHTATLLPNGTVLIAGGRQANATPPPPFIVLPSAEIYDPVGGTITAVSPSTMSDPRFAQSDVLLDDGRALIAGGSSDGNNPTVTSLLSADFFSGAAFSAPGGALNQVRREFSMTKLTDSWVLAVGGIDSSGARIATSEMFEPNPPGADNFMTGASLTNARSGHTATRLLDGRVLVLGGTGSTGPAIKSAEFYNGPY